MTDDMNQSKRKPWTNDPEIVQKIWGENAQAALGTKTAADRLVNQGGSLWPTEQELNAYTNNALPDSQTFTRTPISQAQDVVKPALHTAILPTMVRKIDSTQSLIDSALGLKEAKDKASSKKQEEGPDDDLYEEMDEDEDEPSRTAGRNPEEKSKKAKKTKEAAPYKEIYIPVTHIAMRMKEASTRMQEMIDRNKR
jgi:hypothetical protein